MGAAVGGKSSWSATFHTSPVKLTETDTLYCFDGIEVFRHPSGTITKTEPFWFLVNYAVGGKAHWAGRRAWSSVLVSGELDALSDFPERPSV
jgi:hypothetical protein